MPPFAASVLGRHASKMVSSVGKSCKGDIQLVANVVDRNRALDECGMSHIFVDRRTCWCALDRR